MFAGHVGAALAIGRADRRVNAGALIFAALLLDFLLWSFVLLRWESAVIPPDFASTHQARFVFPYSHGLAASLAWSLLAAIATYLWYPLSGAARLRPAVLVGAAVFSHWLLDALVHVPELPLAGPGSRMFGFGLWQDMPVALVVEGLIVAVGLWAFLPGAGMPRARKAGLCALALAIFGFTIAGMTVAPAPPSVNAMAVSSLVIVVLVSALGWWLTRAPGAPKQGFLGEAPDV